MSDALPNYVQEYHAKASSLDLSSWLAEQSSSHYLRAEIRGNKGLFVQERRQSRRLGEAGQHLHAVLDSYGFLESPGTGSRAKADDT